MAVYAGKVVVVTGASQGIGKALCLALAAQRPRLVLGARDAEIMSAEECARLMVRAMEKRQRMLVMSFKGKLGRWAKLMAPGLVDRMAAESVRKGK